MKKRILLLLAGILTVCFLWAQEVPNTYWLKLKDKKGTPYQISRPQEFLSERAIVRRIKQHIVVDETDLPVSPVYLDSLEQLGLEIVHSSKWLNGATVRTADTSLIRRVTAIDFVESVELTKPGNTLKSARNKFKEESLVDYSPAHYGKSYNQLKQLNGQYLHNKGFRGKGIHIAVLDAGFWHVDQIAAFDSLRSSDRILGTRDFVDPGSDFYQQHTHGMSVLSTMGGNIPGVLVGTSPDASFYLFRSEDDDSEYPIEEDNWVVAAELADSVGADVINSSLGYTQFEDWTMNHTYSDMNGITTRVTQGANMAFNKGILVFSSAGNDGNNEWRYISSPSDGENVLSIAAVDTLGNRASFSSVGPAYGGAVKPNVAAVGRLTFLVNSLGELGPSNGTSFSSPVMAGMGACLLQANPRASVKQIKQAIEQSSSQYLTPDSLIGYGIPDFEKADIILKNMEIENPFADAWSKVWPNPFTDSVFIGNFEPTLGNFNVQIYTLQGVCLWQGEFKAEEIILLKNLATLPDGLLILRIRYAEMEEQYKLIKATR
ncbi:MAG TPA: S8 family serine peptidase [Prolixibacteraceae bacterium]|nr:S8 family serine peptidase [Prolixibacteraceae bacterium]